MQGCEVIQHSTTELHSCFQTAVQVVANVTDGQKDFSGGGNCKRRQHCAVSLLVLEAGWLLDGSRLMASSKPSSGSHHSSTWHWETQPGPGTLVQLCAPQQLCTAQGLAAARCLHTPCCNVFPTSHTALCHRQPPCVRYVVMHTSTIMNTAMFWCRLK